MDGPDRVQARGGGSLLQFSYVVCDVFTASPLAGNQLAVFPDAGHLPDSLRGALAREMNFSESVFVGPAVAGAHASLSIYTPSRELPFAGHPVLGTAAVLANAADRDLVVRTSACDVALAVRTAGPARAEVWMQQPWPRAVPVDEELIGRALGATTSLEVTGYDNGARFALVDLGSPAAVADASPDLAELARLDYGVLCFARAGPVWKARMFGPGIGVPEDPATGSAAGPLAVHLDAAGLLAPEETIEIRQGAEVGRPSTIRAQVTRAAGDLRVRVGGHVVIVAHGSFSLPAGLLEEAGLLEGVGLLEDARRAGAPGSP